MTIAISTISHIYFKQLYSILHDHFLSFIAKLKENVRHFYLEIVLNIILYDGRVGDWSGGESRKISCVKSSAGSPSDLRGEYSDGEYRLLRGDDDINQTAFPFFGGELC